MPATTPRGYEYPLYGDTQNTPAQIQALAEDIDADVQGLYNAENAARTAPTALISQLTDSIPNGVMTTITFDDELYDNAGMVNLGADATAISITSAGLYLVSGVVHQPTAFGTTTNAIAMFLRSVGGLVPDIATVTKTLGSPVTDLSMVVLTRCAVGEKLTMAVQQNSGGAIDVSLCRLSATKVAP
jgi:hypothetical protein